MLNRIIKFFLENKLVTFLMLAAFIVWGIATAPFNWQSDWFPRDPVAVDAIPDIGENQQIVFTEWMGRSPQDVEDQITYPLTTSLLGVPGVKTIRSTSMFGFSSISIIFEENIDFYWSRSRILEKLNSLPGGTLPEGVQPALGPDATGLGQIYWYTLEGRDSLGNVTGGWGLEELRTVQDFYVKYGLSATEGVSEVASVGGLVKEYQVDVDPDAMKAHNISLDQVMQAVRQSNIDVGAQTVEINNAEYFVRGLGYIQNIEDIELSVVAVNENVPIRIKDIAVVTLGPATRRGALDKSGAEVVGGVVVARYGSNPMQVIQNVKAQIAEIAPGLPEKVLDDGTLSKVTIVPFYDRTNLIQETLGTLEEAITLEILITIIVVIIMLLNLRASLLVSGVLPVSVLMCFIAMRYFGVDANIVALSGIAIAIGTMVDMGIVLTESIHRQIDENPDQPLFDSVYKGTTEVSSAVLVAISTTIVSFIPVFAMEAAEGKLFRPLAFTKTFALLASIIVSLFVIPAAAHLIFSVKMNRRKWLNIINGLVIIAGIVFLFISFWIGILLILLGLAGLILMLEKYVPEDKRSWLPILQNIFSAAIVAFFLARVWLPLGVQNSLLLNVLFVAIIIAVILGGLWLVVIYYERILRWCLRNKAIFLTIPIAMIVAGILIMRQTGREFMPSLDEGSFLLMPTSMPHAGVQENLITLKKLDMAVTAIPEVESVVGKMGRAETALDPAPISMYENVINYKSEYITDADGNKLRFEYEDGEFVRDEKGELIPDKNGQYYRQWRDHIQSPDDIWNEIIAVTDFPGVTSAPKLQPIETRLVMLQTGMRAPMGLKIKGPDLATIEAFGMQMEELLKEVDGIKPASVFADRIVGKPYLTIRLLREEIARYGLTIQDVQMNIEVAVGGVPQTTTVEGRERYSVRVRYPRELRDDPAFLKEILISTPTGAQVPLEQLAEIDYLQGPQMIKSEDGFLIGYVIFDKLPEFAEVAVVENAQEYLNQKIATGELQVPKGISYRFSGTYENQLRATKRLSIVLPIALFVIFLILYFEFRSVLFTSMIFSGIFVAFAGGFVMIWLYGQGWFMNFELFDINMRDLFRMHAINLSVAVWVGFIALFGIATDDGVLVGTYLKQSFRENDTHTISQIRSAVVEAGLKRVRPATMTTATTILALLPILTSAGRGADIMIPMAIPSFGGMLFQVITMFVVPVLFAMWQEQKLKRRLRKVNI